MATRKDGQLIARGEKVRHDGTVARVWQIRVSVGRSSKGTRKYHTQTVHGTKKEAQAILTKLLGDRDGHQLVNPSNQRVEEYLEHWLESVKGRVRSRTYCDYKAIVKRYIAPDSTGAIRGLGMIQLSKLTPMQVQNLYIQMQQRGLSPRTVRYAHSVLRSALKHAVVLRVLPSNPAEHLLLPKKQPRELKVLNAEQAKVFEKAAEQDRWCALWAVLLRTGMRPGEALALRWTDLADGRLTIHRTLVNRAGIGRVFETPKTNKSRRSVTLDAPTLAALATHRRRQAEERLKAGPEYKDQGLIFATIFGGPLNRDAMSRKFKKVLRKAGLPDIRMYDLRHSHATLLDAAGVSLKQISARLGHSNISITADTYMAVLSDQQQQAVDSFERLLNAEGS
jgi:integrase